MSQAGNRVVPPIIPPLSASLSLSVSRVITVSITPSMAFKATHGPGVHRFTILVSSKWFPCHRPNGREEIIMK